MDIDLKTIAASAARAVQALEESVAGLKLETQRLFGELAKYQAVNTREALDFLKEPWCILPKSRQEWWVIIPKWVGVQVGWLERATETYNIFVVNRYSHWLGQIPEELKAKLELPAPLDAKVVDGKLVAGPDVATRFKKHVGERSPDGSWRIVRGHEFDLIADLIEAGSLPFVPRPIDPRDLEPNPVYLNELAHPRDYQLEAWEEEKRRGAVIVCWPWGMGKTFIGAYMIASVKGKHLVVVPTVTLKEQWRKVLDRWVTPQKRMDVTVVTYNSYLKVKDYDWATVTFDEAHRLPANTFSRLATIRAKYRMGLSASPYREDGRTSHIFALTGYPIGVDWNRFQREGWIRKPQVSVRLVSGWTEKRKVTLEEVQATRKEKKRTLVFCDSITKGAELAGALSCPHIYGKTKNRLEALDGAPVAVVSRVGDEGLSLPDLGKVIEVDFLGGSRRQESQRVGRLCHAGEGGQHLVLMTQDEFDKFENRFLALEEKGFHVEVDQPS